MPRIVAGAARGRRLIGPAASGVRPTADRTREALFSTLASLTELAGARVLDLYAGTGAVGLEALSRGAATAVLVECNPAQAQVIRTNAATVGLPGARVVAAGVGHFLVGSPEPYDLVFADPPYDLPDAELRTVAATLAGAWTAPGAVVVVERATRGPAWAWPDGLLAIKCKSYGAGTLWYGRRP